MLHSEHDGGKVTGRPGRKEEGNSVLGVKLGYYVPGGYTYGDQAIQVQGVSNLRQQTMGPNIGDAGRRMSAPATISSNCKLHPSSRPRGRHRILLVTAAFYGKHPVQIKCI
jgi:hypothetical protein